MFGKWIRYGLCFLILASYLLFGEELEIGNFKIKVNDKGSIVFSLPEGKKLLFSPVPTLDIWCKVPLFPEQSFSHLIGTLPRIEKVGIKKEGEKGGEPGRTN